MNNDGLYNIPSINQQAGRKREEEGRERWGGGDRERNREVNYSKVHVNRCP